MSPRLALVASDGRDAVLRGRPLEVVRPDLEIIVPAFNEESRIGETLDAIAEQLGSMDINASVRVIDNGSADRTPDVVDAVNAFHRSVDISVEGCSQRGKGSAVARGIMTSSARRVGFCDADLSTPASAITDAVEYLDRGWPVVIGSRHLAESRTVVEQSGMRRLGGSGFRVLTRVMTSGLDLTDTQCGFKFFQREAARAIFSRTRSSGFAFDVEVLSRARDLGYAVKELPVDWTDREGSTFSAVKDGPAVTMDLLRLRRARKNEARRRP